MRVKHHYCLGNKIGLLKFLNKFQIPYQTCEIEDYKSYSFDLYEDQEVYVRFRACFPFVSRLDSIKTIEYSKAEIENAEWLTVQNISIKVQWEYDENAFKQLCPYKIPFIKEVYHRHLEQADILSVTKPVKWGTRQFFSGPSAADDIIFCSKRAKLLLENRWVGLEFWPVKKYNTSKQLEDLYQLYFAECLPIEAFSGGQLAICKGCGRKIMRITEGVHQLVIDSKYLQDQKSVYKTGEVLTRELIGCNTFSLNIVSQEFYQYCEKHGMNRGMIYEPINLIKS